MGFGEGGVERIDDRAAEGAERMRKQFLCGGVGKMLFYHARNTDLVEKHLLSWADSWDNISSDAEKIYSALRRTDSAVKRLFSLIPYRRVYPTPRRSLGVGYHDWLAVYSP